MPLPPDDLPIYRLLTGPDDAEFCRRVSAALALGYRLHGSPAATFNGERVIVAQAVVWPGSAAAAEPDVWRQAMATRQAATRAARIARWAPRILQGLGLND